MPELPEVETIKKGLLEQIKGNIIQKITLRETRFRNFPKKENLKKELLGKSITDIKRSGKYLLFELDEKPQLAIHLGMSGSLMVSSNNTQYAKHDHLILSFIDGKELRFNDPRRFGQILLAPFKLPHGVEPFSKKFTPNYLFKLAQKSRQKIKTFLLDQDVILGLGNIYVSEILFQAGINPLTPISKLLLSHWETLCKATRRVLENALRFRGTTIKDYKDTEGQSGSFQENLKVYGKAGSPCPKCKSIIQEVKIGGRSSFYCPQCQKQIGN